MICSLSRYFARNGLVITFLCVFWPVYLSSSLNAYKEEILLWPKCAPVNDLLYQKVKKLETVSIKPKIPKIIHQIWLGGPVPEKFYEAMQSWKLHHPEWTYILWTDKDVKLFKMLNKALFTKAPNYGMKADLLRIEVLNRYGGLYVDVDQYCMKPHDIFHHICTFYVGGTGSKNVCNNNVIGASKSNFYLKKWIKNVRKNFKDKTLVHKRRFKPGAGTTLLLTGPFFLTNLLKLNGYKDCLFLDRFFFNPLIPKFRNCIDFYLNEEHIKPYTYSVHFHTCSWM